jgi:hypothetical protein
MTKLALYLKLTIKTEQRTKPGWWVASPIMLEIEFYFLQYIEIYERQMV